MFKKFKKSQPVTTSVRPRHDELVFRNRLPYDLNLKIGKTEYLLTIGKRIIFQLKGATTLKAELDYKGIHWIFTEKLDSLYHLETWEFFTKDGQSIQLKNNSGWIDDEGRPQVTIYSPICVLNYTDLDIIYKVKDTNKWIVNFKKSNPIHDPDEPILVTDPVQTLFIGDNKDFLEIVPLCKGVHVVRSDIPSTPCQISVSSNEDTRSGKVIIITPFRELPFNDQYSCDSTDDNSCVSQDVE